MAEGTFDLKRNLIVMLGLQSLPEEKRTEVLDQAIGLIQDRILLRLMQNVDESAAEEADKFSEDPEKLLDFLVEKSGLDLMKLIQQETDKLKSEFLMRAAELDSDVEAATPAEVPAVEPEPEEVPTDEDQKEL